MHPAFDLPKTCVWQLLRQEPLILLAPSSLAVKAPLVTASHEPFIRYDRNVVAGKMADEYLRLHGVRPKVHFELDGIEQIAKLVAEGLGVSVLPDWARHRIAGSKAQTLAAPIAVPSATRRNDVAARLGSLSIGRGICKGRL